MGSHGNTTRRGRAVNTRGEATNSAMAARARPAPAPAPPRTPNGPPPWQGPRTQIAPEARAALARAFGHPLSARTIRALAGAPPSADVQVTLYTRHGGYQGVASDGSLIYGPPRGYNVVWKAWGPPLASGDHDEMTQDRQYNQTRTLTLTAQGQVDHAKGMVNDHFFIAKSQQRQGLATTALTAEVQTLTRLGVRQLTTYAGRSDIPDMRMNGYRTWPALGYNGPLPSETLRQLATPRAEQELTRATVARLNTLRASGQTIMVRDLIATPDGLRWWEKHGTGLELSFNLNKYSQDRTHMARYLRAARAQGKRVTNPATWR